jgi:ubiquinone/menaquinone biosynthesis C-methylase UbiE
LFTKLKNLLFKTRDTEPERAYDLWAKSYDSQPDNLMLALDELVFSELLQQTELTGKIVVDVGCGTGRHWKKILEKNPAKLIGYDVSEGMLQMLARKFPEAITYKLQGNELKELTNDSVDMIISTLTVAHIKNAGEALKEWNRLLNPGGHIIITDYHPVALEKGGKRTFKHDNETVSITNHIHHIASLKEMAGQLNWKLQRLMEKEINETVRHYYEKQNAMAAYESFKGVPIIYGMLFKKDVVSQFEFPLSK